MSFGHNHNLAIYLARSGCLDMQLPLGDCLNNNISVLRTLGALSVGLRKGTWEILLHANKRMRLKLNWIHEGTIAGSRDGHPQAAEQC